MLINASHYIAKLPILAATSVNKPSCLATQPIKIKLIKYNEVRLAGQGEGRCRVLPGRCDGHVLFNDASI